MAGMHHALMIVARVLAGTFSLAAYYSAFCLYQDERGNLQNRFEDLWIEIHERSRMTENLATAIFDVVASIMIGWSRRFFGKRLFSRKGVSPALVKTFTLGLIFSTAPLDLPSKWQFVFFAILIVLICGAVLRFQHPRRHFLLVLSIPFINVLSLSIVGVLSHHINMVYAVSFVIASFSFAVDLGAITFMNKLLFTISDTQTLFRRIAVSAGITTMALASTCLPIIAIVALNRLEAKAPDDFHITFEIFVLWGLSFVNILSAFYCLLPTALFIMIILHRPLWSFVARVIYQGVEANIVTSKKVLLPVGSLALAYAFNLQEVGAKELLKLLAS
jgi:hypothetical protein